MGKTRLSVKGQVVIPQSIRNAKSWKPGLELIVEDHGDSILLTPVKPFPETMIDEVIGCSGYKGSRKSLTEMGQAIARGASSQK